MMGIRSGWLLRAAIVACACLALPAMAQQAGTTLVTAASAAGKFTKGVPLPDWADGSAAIPPTEDRKSPLVILLSDTQVNAGPEPATYDRQALLVNSQGGVEAAGRMSWQFNPAYERFALHTLRIIRDGVALDRMASTEPKFLQRERALEYGVYTGVVTVSVLLEDVRVGDIVEYAFTRHGQNPVLAGKFVQAVHFEYTSRTEWRRVSYSGPESRKVTWRMEGNDPKQLLEPQVSRRDGQARAVWEARQLPAIEIDRHVPGSFLPHREIHFSEFASWTEIAAWAAGLFKPDAQPSPELDRVAAALREKTSEDERAAAALTWVQKEVRYFAMTLGESSHRPAPASVTLQRRYGDCKDKTALLIALLGRLGIQAQPVLVSAHRFRGFDRWLPSPHSFDHVIVRAQVGGKTYYLDPARAGQAGRLSVMGQIWEGAEVLVVAPGTTALARVVSPDGTTASHDTLEETIRVPRLGASGDIEVRKTLYGVNAEVFRMIAAEASDEKVVQTLLAPYEARYPGAVLDGKVRLEDTPTDNRIFASFKLKLPRPAHNAGARWEVYYAASNMEGLLRLPDTTRRSQPMALPAHLAMKYSLSIEFPEGTKVANDPHEQELNNEFFSVVTHGSFRGNRVAKVIDVKVLAPQVQPAKLGTYVNDLRWLQNQQRSHYWVAKTALPATGTAAATTARAYHEKRATETIEQLRRSLEGGRLAPDDAAHARARRAENYSVLGQHDSALADANDAVRAAPHLGQTYAMRATVHARMGDHHRAIADMNEAIALEPRPEHYVRRGIERFYTGQLEPAFADFTRALSDPRGSSKLLATLWYAWTAKRLNKTPDPELVRTATADPRGEWPRPALAMSLGLISVDDMLGLLNGKTGLDKELTLAEAYFAAGQWYMAAGDKAKAAEYFRKTVEMGAVAYVEHRAAVAELKALGVGEK